jgi:glycosyltransferase involved in cell wall biosynthesis
MLAVLNALQAGNRSGTGVYAARLAHWLPEVAEDLDIVVVWPREMPHPRFTGPTREAFVLRPGSSPMRRILYDQFGLSRECRRLRANVVHYPANIGNLMGMRHMVLTVHDLSFLHNPAWFRWDRAAYYRYAVGRSARLASRVIADSWTTANDLTENLGIPPEHIDVIPLGVDPSFGPATEQAIAAVRTKYRLPEAFLLYLGTLEPRKNLVCLIQAWSRIADRCPFDLVLAGRKGWKVGAILREATRSPYKSRIHFPGFIAEEDRPALISAARAFVWPSLCEGFGMPPLEAMACGVPVLTSNVSCLPDILGDSALLVEPTDLDALTEGLRCIAEDDSVRDGLKLRGPVKAAQHTWENTAKLTLATYRAVLSA